MVDQISATKVPFEVRNWLFGYSKELPQAPKSDWLSMLLHLIILTWSRRRTGRSITVYSLGWKPFDYWINHNASTSSYATRSLHNLLIIIQLLHDPPIISGTHPNMTPHFFYWFICVIQISPPWVVSHHHRCSLWAFQQTNLAKKHGQPDATGLLTSVWPVIRSGEDKPDNRHDVRQRWKQWFQRKSWNIL